MLRKLTELRGLAVIAQEDEVGTVSDFLLDDQTKAVRYLVLRTGTWLTERKLLITPISISEVNWLDEEMHLSLTREQVCNSPEIDFTVAISRNIETAFLDYYGYPYYWSGPHLWGTAELPERLAKSKEVATSYSSAHSEDGTHTRSATEITGHQLIATDGEIGRVEDFIVEDESWAIRYLLVNTGNWLSGKSVVVPPQWIERIDWAGAKVYVELTQEAVRNCPEYDESIMVTRDYERQLFQHYGQPGYWHQHNNGSNSRL
jgi:uncharacterized protein YrrD